ncbi:MULTISPECIES: acrylyl-CoA reductase (NADPH) [Bordetella]|uniref:Oxidoreductase n=3 Tax=Bordetella TaxID=517 RepID=A0ABX4FIW7_9BORD|nr:MULTISPECIES: MDR family oxidoreductase [Bordetella]SHP90574.1 putative quinone oxidoreductase, YhdH/YhfP family [Mycobacteroides abscessus subsp. abscessus]AOB28877.1 NADPH:quinone dehydrogenase [Bordetella bronchiseptica]AWP77266.1 oxidoreductase [Bordetella bronchiseptica]AZW24104.1 oxidoreductase [Bordetella bronchiseptica]AZW46232.1 oxidoreductase [Bordetella bronchiseptica]
MFDALVLEKNDDFKAAVRQVDDGFLPDGDVTVDIHYSTLNYKDGLAITNRSPVVRDWPMVAGIDGAGIVRASEHPAWRPGDAVILNGFGVGEKHKGCLAQRARLRGDWLVRLPQGLSLRQAMAIGTAGYTAMLCVMALERNGVRPGDGPVLVTGATGGVGSIALLLLSRLGHQVVAVTGKASEAPYLRSLGATEILDRAELSGQGKPLQKERWSAVVDVVGSHTLANALAQTRYGGTVAACGLAQGADLPATVMPFILRGVALVGVDSVMAPLEIRNQAWQRLAKDLDLAMLETLTREIALAEAIPAAHELMDGKVRGRILVGTGNA